MHACIFNHFFHFVFPVSTHYKLKQLDYILVWYAAATLNVSACAVSCSMSQAFT